MRRGGNLPDSEESTFHVESRRICPDGSVSNCKNATLELDAALEGRADAFNPDELLLAAVSACMIKSIERVAPMLPRWHAASVAMPRSRERPTPTSTRSPGSSV